MPSQTVSLHTFGCKVNQYETEQIREQLALGEYRVVPWPGPADVYLLNSCTVTADADASCRQTVRKLLRDFPAARVVVTGCYAERAPEELRSISPRVEVFGNKEKPLIAVALGVPTACLQTAAQRITAFGERSRAYLKVQDGCDAHCTYCIIPMVRPQLSSRPPDQVLEECRGLVARGFKELVLTGVRLGRYRADHPPEPVEGCHSVDRVRQAHHDSPWDLVRLLEALFEISGAFRVRLSSIEVTEVTPRLIHLMASEPRLCPFFHIPLQSGDEQVLKRMGRFYTAQYYREVIQEIKRQIPEVALSADIIVGFPGEEEPHFLNTAQLVEEEGFSRLHVFRYSVRPGTPAARLKGRVPPPIQTGRSQRLLAIDRQLRERYARRFLNRAVEVLVESDTGYSEHYVRVRPSEPLQEGNLVRLRGYSVSPQAELLAHPV